MTTWVGVALIAVAFVFVWLFNRLVRSRNRVDTAWSDIDVQLQRRHDLIPNIVEAVEAYAGYERATFEAVTELRAQAINASKNAQQGLDELADVELKLTGGIQRLLAVVEDYPELKADQNFQSLQNELVETEDLLQFARRYYNGSVRDFNTLIESVPSNFVAGWFNFTARRFFQKTSDQVGAVPQIKLGSQE